MIRAIITALIIVIIALLTVLLFPMIEHLVWEGKREIVVSIFIFFVLQHLGESKKEG